MPREQGRPIALTKHIDAYVKEVPLAWEAYLKEKSKGTEGSKAERAAMRSVCPGGKNIDVRLNTWKKHKFWPEAARAEIRESLAILSASLSEGIEQDKAELEAVKTVLHDYPHASEALDIWKRCGVWSAESVGHTEEYRAEPRMPNDTPGDTEDTPRMTEDGGRPQGRPRTSQDIPGMSQVVFGIAEEEIMTQLRKMLAEIDIDERKWWGKATGKAPEGEKMEPIGGKISPEVAAQVKSLEGRISHHLEKALKLYLMVLMSAER